ncbi:MAG: hypothetical protein QM758_03585 [Armatimonas sp.]
MKRTRETLSVLGGLLLMFLPLLGWIGLFLYHFQLGQPFHWKGIPLSIMVGVLFYLVTGLMLGGPNLIEMNVGSTIGLILTAIMLPTFMHARKKAQADTCRSHLRQLSLGIKMYGQDYDYALPPAKTWRAALKPYIKDTKTFECPAGRHAYRYDAGRDGILLIDEPPAHGGDRMALLTSRDIRLLPAPSPAPTPLPHPDVRVAISRRGAGSR